MKDHRNAKKIYCSCGRETWLVREGETYLAENARWKFRTPDEVKLYEQSAGRSIPAGWYCGEPDHYTAARVSY